MSDISISILNPTVPATGFCRAHPHSTGEIGSDGFACTVTNETVSNTFENLDIRVQKKE